MNRYDHGDELAGNTGAGECGLNSESERAAADARVQSLEVALGRLLTVTPSPALLAAGVHGEEGAADYLAAYDRARKDAQETLGPYQLDLGLVRIRPEHASTALGQELSPATSAEPQILEREPELER